MTDLVASFSHVSKRFRLGETHDSLRDLIASAGSRLIGRRKESSRSAFWALDDVNFEVRRGEALGIIGPNGAGKSTALKLLAGILLPEKGRIEVNGRLAALIEVGAGFHGDLTGRENVFLNGAILGMDKRDICNKLDAIVAFAGIERFLDMPVKRYSSGMYARLGFAIAAHVDPDILLVDEVLSVGDAVFRLRCIDRMNELLRGGTTLVFVTHNLDQMQSVCQRAVVIDRGKSVFSGPSREAVAHYLKAMSSSYTTRPTDIPSNEQDRADGVALVNLRCLDDADEEIVWARSRQPVRVEVELRVARPIPKAVIELNMRASVNENLLSVNSGRDGSTFNLASGLHRVVLNIPALPLSGGQYFWNLRIWDADSGTAKLDTPFRYPLVLDDGGRTNGVLCIAHDWQHKIETETHVAFPDQQALIAGRIGT